eukprot:TRINITY_DN444_c0_g1_i4.p1 TRINITY_DN444_c0_g1~~TRINITY_DN444_c0_g1_i4.p1  ORF type:complete len:185 (-),score=63.57 TRINITY_DN444_c0_g1_i4:197-751(-)
MKGPGAEATPNAQGFHIKNFEQDGRKLCIKTWDSAGEERFRHLTTAAYRRSEGYLIVFDLADEETFARVPDWGEEIKRYCGTENRVVFVVGNKTDLERVIKREQAEAAATAMGATYFEACALKGEKVNEIFTDLLARVINGRDALTKSKTGGKSGDAVSNLQKSPGSSNKKKSKKGDGGGCVLL